MLDDPGSVSSSKNDTLSGNVQHALEEHEGMSFLMLVVWRRVPVASLSLRQRSKARLPSELSLVLASQVEFFLLKSADQDSSVVSEN